MSSQAVIPGNRPVEAATTAHFDFVSMISRVSQSSEDHASICLNIPHSHWPQGESMEKSPIWAVLVVGRFFCFGPNRSKPLNLLRSSMKQVKN